MRVYLNKYNHPTVPDDYNNVDIHSPYETENMDYIYEQILYRNRIILDADGETFQLWRRKQSGLQCDNPDCGASENINGTPNASCPRCVTEDTEILMADYTTKKITEIKKGDFIISHTGKRQKVTDIFKRKINEKILYFKTNLSNELKVTKEHPMYGILKEKIQCKHSKVKICKDNFSLTCKKYLCKKEFKKQSLGFIEANNFGVRDYFSFPMLENNNNNNITKDFMRLLGYYASEGSLQYEYKIRQEKKVISGIKFGFNSNEKNTLIKEVGCLVKKLYNRKLTLWKMSNANCIQASFKDIKNSKLFHYYCPGKSKTKTLNIAILDLPEDYLLNFIGAFLNGDGWQRKNPNHKDRGIISLGTASKNLANQLSKILLKCGIINRMYKKEQQGGPNNREKKCIIYRIDIARKYSKILSKYTKFQSYKSKINNSKSFIYNNNILNPIIEKKEIDYNGYVYNLEVKNDNSYIANNISVHNCLGTGYIDGFDYQGETLIRIAPAGLFFTVTKSGLAKIHNPRTWTFPDPIVLTQDILIAVDQARLTDEKRTIDEELVRQVDESDNFDSLSTTGVTKILKITDITNSSSRYEENIDYQLSNDGILWLTGGGAKRPGDLDSYYVTYITASSYMRRYEVGEVTRSTWRGKILHQELIINELEVSHVAYDNIDAETYDDSRYLNPFPYSNWFERDNT